LSASLARCRYWTGCRCWRGLKWQRIGSACQGDKLHTVCIGERKHSPVIGRAKESPFLAVGGETLDQHEWRTGVKRCSIAGRKYGTKGSVHEVMYELLERVLSDYFLQAPWHASSLGDWLQANSAYEIYNTHLCLFLADDAGMTRSDIAWPVGIQSTFVEFVFRSGHGSSSTPQHTADPLILI
jgi:hypothetical protein